MGALQKILGTASRVTNPFSAASGVAYAASHGRVGSDITPNYSATNVGRTQLSKLTSPAGHAQAPKVQPFNAHSLSLMDTGGGAYGQDAATAQDQALAARLRGDITNKINTILGVYDALNQGVDATVKDKSNQLNQNYGNQRTGLNNTYSDTANQLAGNFSNRGLGDSSYNANAQDSATRTYNTNLQSIQNAQNSDLANLGQFANSAHAGYNAGKSSVSGLGSQLGNYGSADLQSLYNNLGSQEQQLAVERGGQGTQGQFIQAVNGINPVQNGGVADLQGQLQSVLSSAAPGFAKQAIGQGLITQATSGDPAQQSYWNTYFNQLQQTKPS